MTFLATLTIVLISKTLNIHSLGDIHFLTNINGSVVTAVINLFVN